MNINDLKKEVAKIKWWHTIDLGNGVITPGCIDPRKDWKKILKLPENLRGKTVLDIGAWDGFYSFEAERRGAKRVLATDLPCWNEENREGWGTKAGFELARKTLNSKVEDMEMDVYDISPDKVGVFDLVLLLGVLYHLRHPLFALERVFNVTGDQLVLETYVDMALTKCPVMRFYPEAELSNDPTSWWGPNPAAVEAMLKTVGFRKIRIVSQYRSLSRRVARAIRRKIKKPRRPFFQAIQQNRMVFHAWR